MTTRLIAQNSVGSHGLNSNYLRRDEKLVLDYIWFAQDEGASVKKTISDLKIPYRRAQHIFTRLIKRGEIFQKDGAYCSTAWAMKCDPKATIKVMKGELEKALFGDVGPPERVKVFLEEYHAARTLKLSEQEAWHFSLRRVLEEASRV